MLFVTTFLQQDEDIEQDEDELLLITNRVTGCETLFKPPSRLTFCKAPPQVLFIIIFIVIFIGCMIISRAGLQQCYFRWQTPTPPRITIATMPFLATTSFMPGR